MNVKVETIGGNILIFKFLKQYDLCMTFIRLQEFYESPNNNFKGHYFDLEDYIDWWSKEYGNGSFDYPFKCHGFNVPGNIAYKFFQLFCGKLRDKERELLRLILNEINNINEEIYIIGCHCENGQVKMQDILSHEIAHALYSIYPKYRKECDNLIHNLHKTIVSTTTSKILKSGYSNDVVNDEMQAYFSTNKLPINGIYPKKEFADNYKNFLDYIKK